MIVKLARTALAATLGAALAASAAFAQDYPSHPVKIIVPTAPGGAADLVGRVFAQHLQAAGKTGVVENRTGAGGVIAAEAAAKSAPDGYTVYVGFHPTNAILPHLQKLPYDPAKDFLPVILAVTTPNVLIVNPSVPVATAQELIAYVKANPKKLSYGSPGNGSSGHIVGEQFKFLTGADITHIPYRGAAPALQDLVAGHVHLMFDIVPLTKEQLAGGKVKALAVAAPERIPQLPNVPTMADVGLPELKGGPWFGLFVPTGTPRNVIDWLNAEARKAFSAPDVQARLQDQGYALPLGTPEEFGAHVADESKRWGDVIRRANIKMD
jgi:tripartite-type tricarboxylate transporter receptor subunit TctC